MHFFQFCLIDLCQYVRSGKKIINGSIELICEIGFENFTFKKHLQRGVTKGALTQEEADAKFADWTADKLSKVQSRIEKELQQIEDKRNKRNTDEAAKRSAKIVAKEEVIAAAAAEEAAANAATEEDASEDTASEETATEE